MARGRKSKWNKEQLDWLLDQYPAFEDAQRRNKLLRFWVRMEGAFFKKWPEEDVLGIAPVAPDDGTAEAAPAMSVEDAVRLGAAEKERKKVFFLTSRHFGSLTRQIIATARLVQ